MAVKHTAAILPLCHPIPVEGVTVDFQFGQGGELRIAVEVRSAAKTGVEMEALTGAAVAALCVYDMCKALDPGMIIEKAGAGIQIRGNRRIPSTGAEQSIRPVKNGSFAGYWFRQSCRWRGATSQDRGKLSDVWVGELSCKSHFFISK